jgi:hypothetical protein
VLLKRLGVTGIFAILIYFLYKKYDIHDATESIPTGDRNAIAE